MATRTPEREDSKIDDRYRDNAGSFQRANNLKNLENDYGDSPDASDMDDIENFANDPANSSKNIDDTREKESAPSDSNWRQNYTGKNDEKVTGKGMSKKKKGGIVALLTGGIGGLLIAAFLAILPMKIEAFVQNISKKVDAVPEYAVKQRTSYLVTHTIALRMFQMGHPGDSVVFCKGGTVGCSLFKTYTTNFIEKKYDLKMTRLGNGSTIKIVPGGRTSLGGKATSWSFDVSGSNDFKGTIKRIETNKEMKSFIKDHVAKRIDDKHLGGIVKRYLARKILMSKYGVTKWRGFEKTKTKIADIKTNIKASMIKNTIGRVSQRAGLYFGCINGDSTATCARTIDKIHGDSAEGDAAREKYLGDATPTGDESEKVIQKFFSKQILSKIAGPVGFIMMADMILEAMHNIDNGSLDVVGQDMVAQVDTGYAFGDDTGVVTNAEKAMTGDGDLAVLGQLSQTLDGATSSPLMAADNGLGSPQFSALTGGASNNMSCTSSFNSTPQPIPKDQLVCNNQQFIRNYSKTLHAIPGLGQLFSVASAYAAGPGKAIHPIVQAANGAVSAAVSAALKVAKLIPGVSGLISTITGVLAGPLKALLSLIFDPPPVGVGAGGGNNYVALRGALTNSANQTMEQGVDDNGDATGGGGNFLSNQQVAAIQSSQMKDTATSNSAIASLFSPSIEGSLTQQLILTMPTQPSTMLSSLLSIPSSLFSSISPQAHAISAATLANPMNITPYGYAVNSSAFTASPDTYTPAYCAASAKAREDSLKKTDGWPVPIYTKDDPCALEKMAVGSLLTADGVTDNPYSLKDPVTDSSNYGGDAPATPPTPGGPANLPTGSAQDLAKKILPFISKGALKCQLGLGSSCSDIQNTAKGTPIGGSCAVKALDPTLLGLILGLLQNGQTMVINALCSNHPSSAYGKGKIQSMHNVGKGMDFGEENGVRMWPNSKEAPEGVKKFYTALTQIVGGPNSSVHLVLNQGQCDGHGGLSMLNGYHVVNSDMCHHQHLEVSTNYWSYDQKFVYPHAGIDGSPASPAGAYYGNS